MHLLTEFQLEELRDKKSRELLFLSRKGEKMMQLKFITARSGTFELQGSLDYYHHNQSFDVCLNGKLVMTTNLIIFSLYDLKPSEKYHLEVVVNQKVIDSMNFETLEEYVTLNVKDFGAKGDGINDDTHYIQAAIMACPKKSRVLIPAGEYRIRQLFLKSHVRLEIAKGAILKGSTNRDDLAIFKGEIQSTDQKDYYNLGTWEGNPLDMYAGIITIINAKEVVIYGEGILSGESTEETWWKNPKVQPKNIFRPRLLFVSQSKEVVIQGITFKNSPSWNVHPYFSKNLSFYSLSIQSEKDSPNTDGIDIESCEDVVVEGCHFDLGDDCIAIKSGKIYMARKYNKPSKRIEIRHCLMENGHGAVTLGSELAGGVYDVHVEKCLFVKTDRGLRIKTRRGRGNLAVIDRVHFNEIHMQQVLTPFVANSFYFCDPDGRSDYVQCVEALPVDDRTPKIGTLSFSDIRCEEAHVAAGYFAGLPESKIDQVSLKNIQVNFAKNAKKDVPAMRCNISEVSKVGFEFFHVNQVKIENVQVQGCETEAFLYQDVDGIRHDN